MTEQVEVQETAEEVTLESLNQEVATLKGAFEQSVQLIRHLAEGINQRAFQQDSVLLVVNAALNMLTDIVVSKEIATQEEVDELLTKFHKELVDAANESLEEARNSLEGNEAPQEASPVDDVQV